jgi:TonB family protein
VAHESGADNPRIPKNNETRVELLLNGDVVSGWLLWCALCIATASAQPAPEVIPPKQLETPAAQYPEGAQGNAVVTLELVIAEDGSVANAVVRDGASPFLEAAVQAVKRWRFEPATRNGIAVRVRILAKVALKQPVPPADQTGKLAEAAPSPEPVPRAPTPSEQSAGRLEVKVVSEEREELGSTHIPREDSRRVPGAFADPFRVVEVLPGVAPILSGLPYFFVRGAPPGNIGYYIDGIRVPILFHVGAGPAVITPAMIDRVDLFASVYPARFGRSAGGVMAGETSSPSERGRGEAQARVFDAGAMTEQPFARGAGAALVAGRYSYTGALMSLVAPAYSLGYADYQTRIAYRTSSQDRVSVFAFGAYDKLRNEDLRRTLLDVSFQRVDLRWDRERSGNHLRLATTFSHDRALNAEESLTDLGSTLVSTGIRVRLELDQRQSRRVRLRAGADAGAERISGEREQRGNALVTFPARIDHAAGMYADTILRASKRVEFVPGLRLDAHRARSEDHLFVEPRFASRLLVTPTLAWVSAFGIVHQLPTATVRVPGLGPSELELSEQESWQASESLQSPLPWQMQGKVTLFYNFIDGRSANVTGRTYGLELFLRRDFSQRFGGFLAYTLSRSERTFNRNRFLSSFDRTHVISAVAGYDLGLGYRIGARTYYTSGRPYEVDCPTPDCGPGDPMAPRPYVGRGRLPPFVRVDTRFEKRWTFQSGAWLALTFEWFNALLASETTDVEWSPVSGLQKETRSPLTLPSVGIEGGY